VGSGVDLKLTLVLVLVLHLLGSVLILVEVGVVLKAVCSPKEEDSR
jgi:hypothetical protein